MSIYKYALDFWQVAAYGSGSELLYLCNSLQSAYVQGRTKTGKKIGLIDEIGTAFCTLKNYQMEL